MLTMEYIKKNEKTYQVQIEELTNRVEYEQRRNQRKDKEIERLTKRLEEAQLGYLAVEEKNKRLHSIIKEVREYVYKWEDIGRYKLLEMLDKENK